MILLNKQIIVSIQVFFIVTFAVLCIGCTSVSVGRPHYSVSLEYLMTVPITSALWENTNPNEKIFVRAEDISEDKLNKRDIHSTYSDDLGDETGYLIMKSDLRKLQDYSIRLLATPITLGTDIVIFGVLGYLEGWSR